MLLSFLLETFIVFLVTLLTDTRGVNNQSKQLQISNYAHILKCACECKYTNMHAHIFSFSFQKIGLFVLNVAKSPEGAR